MAVSSVMGRLRPRSIGARTTVGLVVMVALVLVVVGSATSLLTRQAMLDAEFEKASGAVGRGVGRGPGARDFGRGPLRDEPRPVDAPPAPGRSEALMVVTTDGEVLAATPSGTVTDPDPLPDPAVLATLHHEPGTPPTLAVVESSDGAVRYAVAVLRRGPDELAVAARPLADLEATMSSLTAVMGIVGLAALLVIGVLARLVVRLGLRPVHRIAATAKRVRDGDLDARVQLDDPFSEVGGVAATLDRMLDELQAASRAQAESQERLRRFVADASHELRTPLTAMSGYAELYGSGRLTPGPSLDAALEAVGSNARRMERLVEDMLTLAKLDQHRPLGRERVDLAAVAEAAIADARTIDAVREFHFRGRSATVVGDADRLRQVVDNLLSNARSHTPDGTTVVVEVTPGPEHAVLSVADDGPGIPAESVSRLFDRFFRADPARARDRGGSGLGLAIVQAIVRAHGGEVEVESVPGRGTTFTARLPVAAEPG